MNTQEYTEAKPLGEAELRAEAAHQEHRIAIVERLIIENPEGVAYALAQVQEVKARWAELEAQRKSATQPLNATIKTINGWFKPALDSLADLERIWKQKIAAAQAKIERERQKQLALAEAARAKAEEAKRPATQAKHEAVALAAEGAARAARVDLPGLTSRTEWKWEVIDAAALPEDLRTIEPRRKEITALVTAQKGDCKIPGIRVWSESNLAIGKGR